MNDPTAPDLIGLRERVAAIQWFHAIELAPGLTTPAPDATRERLDLLKLPSSLSGKTLLDVGAWDGFFSFEAERRGAARVVAADFFAWHGDTWSSKAGFELARQTLGSRVEDMDVDVMDLSPETVGVFDVVLFLGVLYHVRHPLLALERIASVTRERLVLETHVDLTWLARPAMAFYPDLELDWDPTNWWGPNPAAVAAMLRAVGFRRVEMVTPNDLVYRSARTARRAVKNMHFRVTRRLAPPTRADQGRAVFHAFK